MRIRRRLDQDTIAATQQNCGEQVDRALRTRRHDDLARRGRNAPLAVPRGNRFAQLPSPEHVVPDARHERRGGERDVRHHTGQARPRRRAGLLQIDRAIGRRGTTWISPTQRQRDATRSPGARDVVRVAQTAVRGGHRAATDVQGGGQLAFRGQRGARSETIVQTQQTDAVGQRLVRRLSSAPATERRRQRTRRDSRVHRSRIP
jgi:hypothetical protein